jgi:hypothetical protein
MTYVAVTVSRDEEGNVLVVLKDMEDHILAGATFPPALWYELRCQVQGKGWAISDDNLLILQGKGGRRTLVTCPARPHVSDEYLKLKN